ncbi:MAG: T9SS type A sorting domain-containing protein, partial [Bacteroidales bacterium]|nr:T9SS type A sorting domain-containing protein [Bacteroidales bacterium]
SASYSNQLRYVRIISHSYWNDKHSDRPDKWEKHTGWTWIKIEKAFKNKGLTCDHIVDQNGGNGYDGMRAHANKFNWLRTSSYKNNKAYSKGSWQWLYNRQVAAKKGADFDPSDAGMIIYLLTGIEKTDPSHAKKLMESPVKSASVEAGNINSDLATSNVKVSAHPNPASSNMNVKIEGFENAKIELMNTNGQILIEETNVNEMLNMNVSEFQSGLYIIRVSDKKNTQVKQVIIK